MLCFIIFCNVCDKVEFTGLFISEMSYEISLKKKNNLHK